MNWSPERLEREGIYMQHFGMRVDRPTLHLVERVYFPGDRRPDACTHEVYWMPLADEIRASRRHDEEEQRLGSHFGWLAPVGEHPCLALDVTEPMMGLVYTVQWKPLSRPEPVPAAAVSGA